MPKIIENLPQRLMDEAKRQVSERGYGATTIRSVARGCGVGIGTVYNYFPSKDMLIAGFMLADWNVCTEKIQTVSDGAQAPEPVLHCIYQQIREFARQYSALFQDAAAISGFAGSFGHYHGRLRSQLAAPLEKFCADGFQAEFIAETLLTWTVAGKPYEQVETLIRKLF